MLAEHAADTKELLKCQHRTNMGSSAPKMRSCGAAQIVVNGFKNTNIEILKTDENS